MVQGRLKLILLLGLCIIVTLGCLACLAEPKQTEVQPVTSASSKEVIRFRITWQDFSGRGEAIKRMVSQYNEANPGSIPVEVVGGDEDLELIKADLSANEKNTIYVLPYRYVQFFGSLSTLSKLESNFEPELDLFYPKLLELGTVDHHVFGIPWIGHSICLLYNESLVQKAGIDMAGITSLDKLTAALQSIESHTDAKGIGLVGANHNDVSWMVNQFIYGFGGKLVDSSGKMVAVNSIQARKALDYYRNVLGRYAQPTWVDDTGTEVMKAFLNQEIAFEFQGVWGVTDVEKNGNPFKVGIIELNKIGLYPEVGPLMLSVSSAIDPAIKPQAVKFMQYLISSDAQSIIMKGEYSPEHDAYFPFRVPVRKDLIDSVLKEKYPQFIPFVHGFENPSIDVPVPRWQIIKDKYYAPGLHQVMAGNLSIDQFLTQLEIDGNNSILNQPVMADQ